MELISLIRQRRRPIFIIVVTLVLALVLEAGFISGSTRRLPAWGPSPRPTKAMQAELMAVQSTLRLRDEELAIQRTRHEVDRQALELVRKELAGQREAITGLEGLAFLPQPDISGEAAPD